jgi:hypothetical protein
LFVQGSLPDVQKAAVKFEVVPLLPVVAVAVGALVAVAVAVCVAVAAPVVAVAVLVWVAVALPVVAVAVAVWVAVGAVVAVAVAVVLHVPSFTHQLSLAGVYGEFGGQSRLFGIGAIVWYLDPLKVTDAPFAYAVQLANAAKPVQLT